MIEQAEFLEIINLLEVNYNKKLNDKIIKIWYEEFKNYKKEWFRKAIIDCIKEYSYFPTINQVKEKMEYHLKYEEI